MKKALCLTASILPLVSAFANPAYTTTGTSTDLAGFGDFGISFTVEEDITVTDLSFFGLSLGGADTPYVQLWNDDTDSLLGSVNWSEGEAAAGWNTKALASEVVLQTGVIYQLQASAYWAPTYAQGDFQFDLLISLSSFEQSSAGWSGWTALAAPSEGVPAQYAAIANLEFTAVPEPSTFALFAGGLALGAALRRRRYT